MLSSTAQKAGFMALAHIQRITLSAKHFAEPEDRACSLDEIENAVLSKYHGDVDPSKLSTTAQVAEAKQTLKGKKQLAWNLAPALLVPVVPAAMQTVHVQTGPPVSEESQQESGGDTEGALVLTDQ